MAINPPLVSVVIPVYNGASAITATIKSVQSQTLRDLEVICVDDCSTDSSCHVVEKLCAKFPSIQLVCHDNNQGPLAARMTGFRASSGKYVAFLDCGDRFTRDGLQQMVLAAESTDSDVVVGASKLRIPYLGKMSYCKPRTSFYEYVGDHVGADNIRRHIYKGILEGRLTTSIWDKLYNRVRLLKFLPENVDFRVGEDYYFLSAVMPYINKIHFTDADFYEWTYSGMARKYFLRGYRENLRVMDYILGSVGKHSQAAGMSPKEAKESVAAKLIYQVILGVVERYLQSLSWGKAEDFADKILRTSEMKYALTCVSEYCGHAASDLSAEKITSMAKEHLHEHRKFYIFTRLLSLIYRV